MSLVRILLWIRSKDGASPCTFATFFNNLTRTENLNTTSYSRSSTPIAIQKFYENNYTPSCPSSSIMTHFSIQYQLYYFETLQLKPLFSKDLKCPHKFHPWSTHFPPVCSNLIIFEFFFVDLILQKFLWQKLFLTWVSLLVYSSCPYRLTSLLPCLLNIHGSALWGGERGSPVSQYFIPCCFKNSAVEDILCSYGAVHFSLWCASISIWSNLIGSFSISLDDLSYKLYSDNYLSHIWLSNHVDQCQPVVSFFHIQTSCTTFLS